MTPPIPCQASELVTLNNKRGEPTALTAIAHTRLWCCCDTCSRDRASALVRERRAEVPSRTVIEAMRGHR
jgi:hypothetical protein